MVVDATTEQALMRIRRRLAHSPYAPRETTVPRTDVLARLLVERLTSLGSMTEAEAIDALESRAPGQADDAIRWARMAGLVRRVDNGIEPAMLEAASRPRQLAA